MLPASFQTPAAIILIAGGLLSCFAGYRVFRTVLGFFGFVIGALLTSSLMGTEQTLWMIAGAIVGGIAFSTILTLFLVPAAYVAFDLMRERVRARRVPRSEEWVRLEGHGAGGSD